MEYFVCYISLMRTKFQMIKKVENNKKSDNKSLTKIQHWEKIINLKKNKEFKKVINISKFIYRKKATNSIYWLKENNNLKRALNNKFYLIK